MPNTWLGSVVLLAKQELIDPDLPLPSPTL